MVHRRSRRVLSVFALIFFLFFTPLFSETPLPGRESHELSGPVREAAEKRAVFKELGGEWQQEREYPVSRITFNTDGKVTYETRYSGGVKIQEVEYVYDAAGTVRKIIDSRNDEVRIQHFDESGIKIEDIRSQTGTGQVLDSWKYQKYGEGSAIEYRLYSYDGTLSRREFTTFDEAGRMVEKLFEPMYRDRQRWEYDYDSAGNLIQGRYFSKSYYPVDTWHSIYDEQGNLVEIRHFKNRDRVHSKRSFYYDDKNRKVRQVARWYSQNRELESTWTYIYDSRGNVTKEVYRHEGKSFSTNWSYVHDSRDIKTGETFYNSRGSAVSGYLIMNEYDAGDNLLDTVRKDLSGTQLTRTRYYYNRQGDLTETVVYNADNSLHSKTTYQYEYDDRENWVVKRTLYTDNLNEAYDVPTLVQFRTITYYE